MRIVQLAAISFILPTMVAAEGLVTHEYLVENRSLDLGDSPVFSEVQERELQRRIAEAIEGKDAGQNRPTIGYENGFVIASPKTDDTGVGSRFSMRINSWMHFRHTVLDANSDSDQNDFEFERLRLTFGGNVYSQDIRYFLQIDGDTDQGSTSDWLDYYATVDLGHATGGSEGSFGIKVGKWKLPFNRARAESGWKLQFSDRSIASVFFDINRSQGVALFGKLSVLGRDVRWETALSNGFKGGSLRASRSGDLDRNLAFSSRLWSDWIGEWGSDGEPDLTAHQRLAMRVGAGFAYTRHDREGAREFGTPRVVDSGDLLSDVLPGTVDDYNYYLYSVDANWKYRGMSLLSEYYFRTLDDFVAGDVDSLFDHGMMIQSGVFIIPSQFELIGRWSRIQGDSATLGLSDQSSDEIAAGMVWYFNGHHAKLTFDVTRLNGAPIRDTALNILPGDDGILYRTQFQLHF